MPILITGGTGTLGRRIVKRPRVDGAQVRVLSRGVQPAGVLGRLFVLAPIQAGTGAWMALAPQSFYDSVLGVSALPPTTST